MVAQEGDRAETSSTYESESPPKIPSRVGRRYKIRQEIGRGSFSVVHKGIDRVTGQEVAVKFEWTNAPNKMLLQEACLHEELAGTRNIPQMYWCGTEGEYNVMVLELLGPNLCDLLERYGCKFSMESVLKLWEKMIDRVMFLHSRGIIHRDLKPSNFLVGTKSYDENLYIIDFGLSKKYVGENTRNHIPMRKKEEIVGTARFMSETVQSGWEPCRRDDLISVGYAALLLLTGKLPWQNYSWEKSLKCKKTTTHKDLCKGLPDNFVKYFDYSSSLAYDDTPDYNYLKQLVRNSSVQDGIKLDNEADSAHGSSVLQRQKSKHKKHRESSTKASPAKHSSTPSVLCKATWDQISSVALKKIMFIKESLSRHACKSDVKRIDGL